MDIKRAKKEIKDSIEAYLATDEYGDYMIPSIRQRWQRSVKSHWYLIRTHIIPDKVRSDFRLLKRRRTMGKGTRLQNIR